MFVPPSLLLLLLCLHQTNGCYGWKHKMHHFLCARECFFPANSFQVQSVYSSDGRSASSDTTLFEERVSAEQVSMKVTTSSASLHRPLTHKPNMFVTGRSLDGVADGDATRQQKLQKFSFVKNQTGFWFLVRNLTCRRTSSSLSVVKLKPAVHHFLCNNATRSTKQWLVSVRKQQPEATVATVKLLMVSERRVASFNSTFLHVFA